MKSVLSQADLISIVSDPQDISLHRRLKRWEAALFVSLLFLVWTVLFVTTAYTFQFFDLSVVGRLYGNIGTILLFTAFPAGFFAAHCIDKANETKKAIRLAYCRQHGLRTDDL